MRWGYPLAEIGDLVSSVKKWNPRQSKTNELIKYIDIASVNRETKQIECVVEVFAHEAPSRARQLVIDGDVLVSTVRPNLNAVAHLKKNFSGAIASTGFTVLRSNSKKIYDRYLYYWVRSPYFVQDMIRRSTGASYPAVSDSIVKAYNIPLPPLEEQKRIAAILDKADTIRRSRQEAIRLTEELLRSTFLDMFGDPVRNSKGWNILKFGSQVDELKYGTNAKCSEFRENGDIPVLRIPNIVNEKVSLNELKYAKLESSEVDKLLLKQDDLLFVRSNGNPDYIGRCALFEEEIKEAVYASYLIRARLKKDTNFYSAFIRDIVSFPTFRSRLAKEARTTAGNYNINTQGLKSLKLICPPKEKQRNYLKFREKITERLKVEHNYLNISSTLFNSLLQKAFRGEL